MVDGLSKRPTKERCKVVRFHHFLANICLDDFDKELERRGHHFVRYADDFLIFTKTEAAAKRVFDSVEHYLTRKLKLVVNRQKSRVCRTAGVEFLGFAMHGWAARSE